MAQILYEIFPERRNVVRFREKDVGRNLVPKERNRTIEQQQYSIIVSAIPTQVNHFTQAQAQQPRSTSRTFSGRCFQERAVDRVRVSDQYS